MTYTQKEKIKQLRNDGLSYLKIAAILGISENTVKSFCRRNSLGGNIMQNAHKINAVRCRKCGIALTHTAGAKQKLFCSDKCRMAWWNSHPEAVNRKSYREFTCQTCGLNFNSYGKRERKYCSRTCYGKSKVVGP